MVARRLGVESSWKSSADLGELPGAATSAEKAGV
jgi:acetaldehyde dehydrogenase